MKIKERFTQVKKKVIDIILLIKWFFFDVFGWVHSLWIYCFRSIKRPGIFYGYANYYWASKYADKRTKRWRTYWDQMGKEQGTFPIEDIKLIVCSKLEMKAFKKAKIVNKNLKPRKALKKSYYTTKI